MINQNIRIRLKSFDHNILDRSSIDILQTAKRTGAKVIGPIPMPSRIERVTVNKSPHVDKKSREQFELRTHIRMMDTFCELCYKCSVTICRGCFYDLGS